MTPAMRIDLFGVECNTDVADANGVRWTAKFRSGWSSPTQMQDVGQATGRHGGVLLDERHGTRTLVVGGWAFAPDQETAWEAFYQLAAMPGIGASGDVVVHEPVPKVLTVRQGEEPRADSPAGAQFQYLLTLVALDPFKRAQSAVTTAIGAGATVNLTNNGTAPAFLTVAATGSGTVRISQDDSGQVLRSKASVASGTTFNGSTKRVTTSGGVTLLGVLDNPSEWLSIPRLDTVAVTNEGTAPVDVTHYHSYA